jgi:hypothetical protein
MVRARRRAFSAGPAHESGQATAKEKVSRPLTMAGAATCSSAMLAPADDAMAAAAAPEVLRKSRRSMVEVSNKPGDLIKQHP